MYKESDKIRTAKQALLTGGRHILDLFGKSMDEIGTEYKPKDGDTPRTLIDTYSENAILNVIKEYPEFSDDTFNPEESGQSGCGKRIWHIDPYDGTSNAQIKLAMSTSGIGISEDGKSVASVVLNPFERKLYWAEQGKGAYVSEVVNDGTLHEVIGTAKKLQTDTISDSAKTRFAWVDALFNSKTSSRKLEWIRKMQEAGFMQNIRMTGSNIDYSTKIAEGRGHYQLTDAVGGFFDLCGFNLIEEAGGKMVNLKGNQPIPGDQIAIAVANPRDLETTLKITQECYLGYNGFR